MDNDTRIRKAAGLVKAHVSELAKLLDGYQPSLPNPHIPLVVASCVYIMRQVQAICILTETNGQIYYAEQAEQLVRGLCEAWAKVSWMIQPEDKSERDYRTRCLYNEEILQHERILKYRKAYELPIYPKLPTAIEDHKRQVEEYEEYSNRRLEKIPSSKCMYELLGRSDLYVIFRYESGPVHASLNTIGGMLNDLQDNSYIIGAPSRPSAWGKVLSATMCLVNDTGPVVTRGLEINIENWIKAGENTQKQVNELLSLVSNPSKSIVTPID